MAKPRLLICGFGAFPGAPQNPSAAAVEALARAGWTPRGVVTSYLTLPVAWRASAEKVEERLAAEPVEAVLLVGLASEAAVFRVETMARNQACATRADDSEAFWPTAEIQAWGRPTLEATTPCQAMAAAIEAAGLPVALSADAGDYLCNFTFYRLLHAPSAPAVGFLHVPQAHECAAGAAFSLGEVETAVRAAASAVAAALTD